MQKAFVFFVLLALLVPVTILAQDEEGIYTDPQGLFTVPIPTNWTVQEAEGYTLLASPDNELEVYLTVADSEDSHAAIEAAWKQIDPEFSLEPADTQEYTDPALLNGTEEIVIITYDNPDDPQTIFQGVGLKYQGKIYIQLFKGSLTAIQQRSAQIQILNTGYKITTLETDNLVGAEPLPLSDELLAELETYIAEKMEQLEVAGASIAIVQGSEIVYLNGFGVRGGESSEPVTPETLMMIGSTTKTMTTMLMGTLVDEGLMAWDTPVTDVLPNFALADPERTQQITMQNLVCACTGVPRQDYELIFNGSQLTAENIVEALAGFQLYTDFGEAFQYSNQMVAVGGYAAVAAAGGEYGNLYQSYVELMGEYIFEPIGMESTTFSFEEVEASGNYALPHTSNAVQEYQAAPIELETWVHSIAPAGGVWSNAADMANYLMTELNEGTAPTGTQVISSENLAYTWQPQVQMSAEASYGLGWISETYKGLPILSHGGNMLGFTSELAFLPEHEIGIVVLSNQVGSAFNIAVRYRLLELLFGQEAEFDAQLTFVLNQAEESISEGQQELLATVDAAESLVGIYTNQALGDITLEMRDGKLYLNTGEFETEIRAGENEEGEVYYLFYDAPLAGLTFKPSEDYNTLTIGEGVMEYTFERVE